MVLSQHLSQFLAAYVRPLLTCTFSSASPLIAGAVKIFSVDVSLGLSASGFLIAPLSIDQVHVDVTIHAHVAFRNNSRQQESKWVRARGTKRPRVPFHFLNVVLWCELVVCFDSYEPASYRPMVIILSSLILETFVVCCLLLLLIPS
jgi:hypothetical protein